MLQEDDVDDPAPEQRARPARPEAPVVEDFLSGVRAFALRLRAWRRHRAICAPIALGVLLSLTACSGHAGRAARPATTPDPADESAEAENAEAEPSDTEALPAEADTSTSTDEAEATGPSEDASEPEPTIRLAAPIEPRAGATVEGQIEPGETVVHPIHLEADEYLEAHVDLDENLVELSLYPPGSSPERYAVGTGEPAVGQPGQTLWTLAEFAATYRLRLDLTPDAGPEAYRLTLLELKTAGPKERAKQAGQKHWEKAVSALESHHFEDALVHLDPALELWSEAEYLRGVAAVYGRRGRALLRVGRPDAAVEAMNRSIAYWKKAEDHGAVITNLTDLAQAQADLQRWDAAEETLQKLTAAIEKQSAPEDHAFTLEMICEVRRKQGRTTEAIDACLQATESFERIGKGHRALGSLLNLGLMNRRMGRLVEARQYYQRVLEILEEHPNPTRQATIHNNLGILYENLGEFQEALLAHRRAMELYREQGNIPDVAMQLFRIGTIHERMGDLEGTLTYYERARALQSEVQATDELVNTLLGLGSVHLARGDIEASRDPLQKALDLSRASKTPPLVSRSLQRVAELRLAEGKPAQALELLQEALESNREAQNRWTESRILSLLAEAQRYLGEPEKTLDTLRRAAALNDKIGHRRGLADNHYRIAQIFRDRGDLTRARHAIDQALSVAGQIRQRIDVPEMRSLIGATHQSYFDLYIALLMDQHARDPDGGHAAEALKAAERARARSLLEVLSTADLNLDDRVPPELVEERERLRRRLAAVDRRRAQLLGDSGDPDELELFEVKFDLDGLLTDLAEVERRMRTASPAYGALTRPGAVTIGEIQRTVLDPHTALLEFRLGEPKSFLFAVTAQGFETFELPGRKSLEEAARCIHWLITAFGEPDSGDVETRDQCLGSRAKSYENPPGDSPWEVSVWRSRQIEQAFPERAAKLAERLLGEAERQGFLDGHRIAVVPDGALEYLPFASLPHPRTGRPLIRSLEVVNLPSASFLHFHRRQSTEQERVEDGALAIIADPVYGRDDERVVGEHRLSVEDGALEARGRRFSRLDFASEEARAIAAFAPPEKTLLALGPDASRGTVLGPALADRQYIHFATHGVIDTRYPQLSRLVLSLVDGKGRLHGDGSLRLHDIYDMDLDAEMVVLSACDTALGREVRGEGLVGLARGFMYAGAERVVASLWPVLDGVTADLMEDFYRGLLQEGRSPADALRRAQLAMISRSDGAFSFPYYWAGFVFQGDWR